jgi:hypothetical protein
VERDTARKIDPRSLAKRNVVGKDVALCGNARLTMNAVNVIGIWLRAALWCGLFGMLSAPLDALALSRRIEAAIGDGRMAFLSETRDEPAQPAGETPPPSPQDNSKNFDGAWTFTSAGCPRTGSLPAMITGGKIIVKGGSGQVDPDGTLHSVGAGGGMTLTAVGRLLGNTGSGTFSRSDGCVGNWIAIKH